MKPSAFRLWFNKAWRYVIAYILFVVFVVMGLAITWQWRSNVLDLALAFQVSPQITYILHSWGSYLVFVPYVFFIGLLEPYLNRAAKNKQLLNPVFKISLLLTTLELISLLVSWGCAMLSR
jgi:hypothetical protein